MTTFPEIERIVSRDRQIAGIRTRVGNIQYGNTAPVGKSEPTAILEALEADLRAKVEACRGEVTAERLMPDAQVTGPNLVFKDGLK